MSRRLPRSLNPSAMVATTKALPAVLVEANHPEVPAVQGPWLFHGHSEPSLIYILSFFAPLIRCSFLPYRVGEINLTGSFLLGLPRHFAPGGPLFFCNPAGLNDTRQRWKLSENISGELFSWFRLHNSSDAGIIFP